jgi:hypothetical protein
MKMYKTLNLTLLLTLSAIIFVAGCQTGGSAIAQQKTDVAETSEPAQAKADETESDTKEPGTPQEDTAQQTQKIVLTKATHDFGQVGPGTSHKADYAFINEGQSPLLVTGVQSTCGCSKPTLIKDGQRFTIPLKEPVSFEPGEDGKVEVTFKAGVTKSNVNKHIYILSDDPATPRAQLDVKAQIVVKVAVEPEKVELNFDQDNAGMPELLVKSIDGQAFSITSVSVVNNVIKVPFDPEQEATEFTLKPEVDIEKLNQFSTGVIQISTTHPQAGRLMVRYSSKPVFEMSNPRYILQNVEPGQPIIRENLIRSNYGKMAEIESFGSKNGYMDIESQQQDGNHIKLKIKITPPAQDSKTKRYITDELKITLKDGHELKVRCSGWFRLK